MTTISEDTLEFFRAQEEAKRATSARILAKSKADGSFAAAQWRRAALEALTLGAGFSVRATRAPAKRWDGRMTAVRI
jgi:hypothetical protein